MQRFYCLLLMLPFAAWGQRSESIQMAGIRTSTVIVYRERSDTAARKNVLLELNNEPLETLANGTYATYEVRPGQYTFRLAVNPPPEAQVTLEPDKVYYLRIHISEENEKIIASLEFVDGVVYREYFSRHWLMRVAKRNVIRDSVNAVRLKMDQGGQDLLAVSIDVGSGIGFEQIPMVVLTNGDEASISGGGGGTFGISLIYRFTPHFDVVGEIATQSSYLTPTVKNADITFKRLALGLAARVGQPLGRRWRINAGPGVTWFRSPKMTADLNKLSNGYTGEFKYNPSTGYYFLAEGEYFFKSFSLGMGMKWNDNSYSLQSAKVDGHTVPLDDPGLDYIRTLNGAGYFFFWNFRFYM